MLMKLSEHNRRQGHYTLLSVKRIRTMEKCTTAKAERRNRCPKWRRWDAMRLSDLKELGLWQAYHTPGERPRLQDSISRHDGLMDLPMSYLWVRLGLNYRMTYSNGSGCITIPLHSQGPYLWEQEEWPPNPPTSLSSFTMHLTSGEPTNDWIVSVS